ncbi:Transportin-2 [Trichinella pseudospiralis]|uniref:Transportin-1 n=1 Tax=Trichinella pseudospiralis TaxID=6337 RepID=A0A0V0YHV9_TRIPS|nr:Transportin-2 [Trichinella pseudospiralis]
MAVEMSTAEFQPQADELAQVLELLKQSQISDTAVQREVQKKLEELKKIPTFSYYLLYVLTRMTNEQQVTRSLGGLILKNNIHAAWSTYTDEAKRYVKAECVHALDESNQMVRTTVDVVIASILSQESIHAWPDLVAKLLDQMHSNQDQIVVGAFSVVQKICEDSAFYQVEDREYALRTLMPALVELLLHQNTKVRLMCLQSVNFFLGIRSPFLDHFIDDRFLARLFNCMNDLEHSIHDCLCQALSLLCNLYFNKLTNYMPTVARYILHRTSDLVEHTALEACEFWLTLAEEPANCREVVRPYLAELIPVLVRRMRYSEQDLRNMKADLECDEQIPDRAEDIQPRFRRSKQQQQQQDLNSMTNVDHIQPSDDQNNINNTNADVDASDHDDHHARNDNDNDDEDDDSASGCDFSVDASSEWNVRKGAAATLDVLSNVFRDELLPHLLPILDGDLFQQDWLVKEAAILALGAVAEGCANGMAPHLPTLVPYLIGCLNDNKALVRSITCWTLSRYGHWILQFPNERYFEQLLKELLRRLLDVNKRVQEAACSAFATLEEEANFELVPYLNEVVQTLCAAFQKYQAKNLLILYDAVGTLAESIGTCLAKPELVDALMPPLMAKWNRTDDTERERYSLLECMASVVVALQDNFLPYCTSVFSRCVQLISCNVQTTPELGSGTMDLGSNNGAATVQNNGASGTEVGGQDFVIASLDLLSGMVETLGQQLITLVAHYNLVELVKRTSLDQSSEVRQSSFALVGDLARTCWPLVEPHVMYFLTVLGRNLEPQQVSVCNNAIWALGELAMKMGSSLLPHARTLCRPLVAILNRPHTSKTLLENAAITVGRFGVYCSTEVAPQLPDILLPWCLSMRNLRDNDEKESAFCGLCRMVIVNPEAVVPHFAYLCDAFASWSSPKSELKALVCSILYAFRQQMGEAAWQDCVGKFPSPMLERLQYLYGF